MPTVAPPDAPRRRLWLRALVAAALGAVLIGYVFPRVVGTTGADVVAAFHTVSGRQVVLLTGLWAAGLLTHSFVLTGALPGLTRRRALTLNLTGSAVANTLPFGGAAGMSMNYVMIRSLGRRGGRVRGVHPGDEPWGIVLKLVMPTLAVAALWSPARRSATRSGGPRWDR